MRPRQDRFARATRPNGIGTPPAHGRLATSFRWLVLSYAATKVTALATVFLVARSLGDDLFGRFAIALAIPLSIEAIADLGLGWALIREGAGRPDVARRLAYAALVPKATAAITLVAVSYALALAAGLPAQVVEAVVFLALAKAADSLTYLFRAVFQSHERMDYDAAALTFDGAVRLILVVYAVSGEFGLVGFAKAYTVSSFVVLLATAIFCFHRLLWPPVPTGGALRKLFRAGIPLAAIWLLDGIGGRVGVLILGGRLGDAAAGNFAAALRLIEPLLAVPALMSAALLPLAARHILEQRRTTTWLFEAVITLAMLVASAASITLIGVGPLLVEIVFGSEFVEARDLVGPLALGLMPLFVHGILLSVLVALRRPWALMSAQAIGIALNAALAVLLAEALGTLAGAAALVISEFALVAVAFLVTPELRALRIARLARTQLYAATCAAGLTLAPLITPVGATAVALSLLGLFVWRGGLVERREVAYLESTSPLLARILRSLSRA